MLERMFPEKSRIAARRALASILLVTNAFVWYFFAITILINIVGMMQVDYFTTLLIWSVHFAGIAFSAIIGATLVRRLGGQTRFFILWMILGIVSSVTSIAVDKTSAPEIIILSLFLGVSLGIGMPSCMGYFTESVEIDHRGRAGGIILLLSGLLMAVLGMISSGDVWLQTFILSAWRVIGLVFFLLFRQMGESVKKSETPLYKSILSQRPFILYLVPWIMFSLITYLTYPIQSEIVEKSTLESLQIIENVLGGIFAIVGGFLADIMGRKRMAIVGFAMLGLGYSVLGIFPEQLYSWYFYTVVDGVAWGFFS